MSRPPPPPPRYQPGRPPVVNQPGRGQAVPAAVCPRGLEYLSMLDHAFIKQNPEVLETVTGFEVPNKYVVINRIGQPFYVVEEEVDTCALCYGGGDRPFEMDVIDIASHMEVIHISRPCRCCVQEVVITCPSANNILLGYVRKRVTFFAPYYEISDGNDVPIFKVEGPAFIGMIGYGYDIDLKVRSLDGSNALVANIRRHWPGILMDWFTDADNFGVAFPIDLDVKMKALLLGATILIDYTLYER